MSKDRTIKRGDGFVQKRIRRDGSIAYQARWHDGKKWRARTFDTEDDGYDYLRQIGRDKRSGRYVPDTDLTVTELVQEYIARGQHRWRTNTVATYTLIERRQISPYIGRERVATLSSRRVQTWIDDLVRDGYSAAKIENARVILSGACKEAVNLGMIPRNPVTGTRSPSKHRKSFTTWTPDDVARVLVACRGDLFARTYYQVALATGMRPGEIRALKWADIAWERRTVTVQRSMTRSASFSPMVGATTKTGRARVIAIPENVIEALTAVRRDQLERRLRSDQWVEEDLVFDRGDGTFVPSSNIDRMHARVIAAAGVRKIRLHDLRHTAATLMLENGIHPKVVSEILGHKSIATTLDIYTHVSVDLQRDAVDRMSVILGSASRVTRA